MNSIKLFTDFKNPKFSRLLDYASWADLEKKFLYVETPKVACSKIKQTLQKICGYNLPDPGMMSHLHTRDLDGVKFVNKLSDFKDEEIDYLINSEEVFRFCFVRNPYSRLFSAYKNKIFSLDSQYRNLHEKMKIQEINVYNDKISFIEFVISVLSKNDIKDHHWLPQSQLIFFTEMKYDFIGRFENFENDFRWVVEKLTRKKDIINSISEKVNFTPTINEGPAYNYELAGLVYKKYLRDFKVFGYDKDSWI
jgi:hypothetical protein